MKRILSLLLVVSCVCIFGCSKGIKKEETAEDMFAKAQAHYDKRQYVYAIEVLNKIKEKFPKSPLIPDVELLGADSLFKQGKYADALQAYQEFFQIHPTHPKMPYASYQEALCYFEQKTTPDRDQTSTEKALKKFQFLMTQFPESEYASLAKDKMAVLRNLLAEHEFVVGDFYLRKKKYNAALKRFVGIMERYPEARIADRVLFSIGKLYLETGDHELAKTTFQQLSRHFKESEYILKAEEILKDRGM
ncbi:MAG: outer membrane protein assembly factor BamD [Thermodesulfobacteriota bacterium]|nr:outer membrane protein assembly factor BamD [Thermodesulfobacteriota bacterium]